MGGSLGRSTDTFLNATVGQALGNKNFSNVEESANELQTHYEKQWQGLTNKLGLPDLMNEDLPSPEELTPTPVDETSTKEGNNPFSMASYGNNVRQRRKSGFGRRQTFKGLTG